MMLLAAAILLIYGGYILLSGGDSVIAGAYLAVGSLFAVMLFLPRRKK
jgi:hypothetical protein